MKGPAKRYIKYAVVTFIMMILLLMYKNVSQKTYVKRSVNLPESRLLSNVSRFNLFNPVKQHVIKAEKEVLIDKQGLIHAEYANATPHVIPEIPDYAIVNKNICNDPRLRFLVYTYSAPDHFDGRDVIRKSYGNTNMYKDKRLGRVFFLAQTKDPELQQKIEEESKQYGDIVQAKYIDTYTNLTLKGIFTIKFFKDFCRKNIIAIKTDDDLFYDIFYIIHIFEHHKRDHKFVACPVQQENTMPILRDPKTCSKWCVQKDELKGRDGYPRYCSGWVWIFPLNFVDEMLKAIARTRFFGVEDFFISGFIMGQVPHLEYIDLLDNTTIYANPAGSGMIQMMDEYYNMALPRRLILTDVPDVKALSSMWNHCINGLYSKFPDILEELDTEELTSSINKMDMVMG